MAEGLFSTKASLDTSDFKTGTAEIARELRVLESGFRANAASMEDWSKDSQGLEMRAAALGKEIEAQGKKVALTRAEYERMVTVYGANSKEAQTMEIRLNKEAEILGKMQTELSGTTTKLSDLSAGNKEAGDSTKELGEKQTSLGEIFKHSWTEINSAIGVAKQVFQLLKGAVDETIGKYVKLADVVRTLTQINGESAESNSRLIQTLDDYKVSSEDAITAQRKLATQHRTLNIPTLMELSDAYLKLNTGAERQEFLTANFGRASAGWAEVMVQGSAAIKARADAVEEGLILDQASLDLARKLELQQDSLADSTLALKVAIGEKLTPAVIEGTKAITESITMSQLETRARELGIDVTNLYVANMDLVNGEEIYHTELLRLVTQAEWDNSDATNEGARALARMDTGLIETTGETDMFTGALLDANTALQQQQAEFGFIISFAKQYETNLANVTAAEGNLKLAEDNLAAARAKWPEGNQKVIDAQTAVDGLKAKLGEAKQASLDATNEMIAGFLQAQLAADGSFTENDIRKVLNYRLAVGLITQEAYDAALEALKIAENLAKIPDETINVDVEYNDPGWNPPGGGAWGGGGGGPQAGWMQHGGPIKANSYLWNENPFTRPEVFVGGGGFVLTKQDALEALGGMPAYTIDVAAVLAGIGKNISLGLREGIEDGIPNLQDQLATAMRGLTASYDIAINSRMGIGAPAGAGNVDSHNDNRRNYVITNAGINAAELERIQRRQELLYGN